MRTEIIHLSLQVALPNCIAPDGQGADTQNKAFCQQFAAPTLSVKVKFSLLSRITGLQVQKIIACKFGIFLDENKTFFRFRSHQAIDRLLRRIRLINGNT